MSATTRKSGSAPALQLPSPTGWQAIPLSAALAQRRTTREISTQPLSDKLLANLLWAAFGVNRRIGPFGMPGRTAASASNAQEIDVYVALKDGAYLYDAWNNQLRPIVAGDLRSYAMTPGQQGTSSIAPVQLIYVADVRRLTDARAFQEPGLRDPDVQKAYYYVDTGLIASNVYLFAADQGLAAWFHNCDREALTKYLGLGAGQHALFAQSVGYPVRESEQ